MVFEMKLGLVGVVCSGVVDTKFIINNGWVEDFIKITIRVFDFLVDGINQVHNTCFDVESVKSGVMSRFTWNNGYLVDFFISFLL